MTENQRKNRFRKGVRLLWYLDRTVQIFVEVGPADPAIGVLQQNLVGAVGFGASTSSTRKSLLAWKRRAFMESRTIWLLALLVCAQWFS